MTDSNTLDDQTYRACDGCGSLIRYGNALVTVSRTVEQVDRDPDASQARVTVIDSRSLLTLCARCGNLLNARQTADALRSQLPRRDPPTDTDVVPGDDIEWLRDTRAKGALDAGPGQRSAFHSSDWTDLPDNPVRDEDGEPHTDWDTVEKLAHERHNAEHDRDERSVSRPTRQIRALRDTGRARATQMLSAPFQDATFVVAGFLASGDYSRVAWNHENLVLLSDTGAGAERINMLIQAREPLVFCEPGPRVEAGADMLVQALITAFGAFDGGRVSGWTGTRQAIQALDDLRGTGGPDAVY